MSELELLLIQKAKLKHRNIFPCAHKAHLGDCFTRHGNRIIFWYNTEDESTHVLVAEEE